MLHHVDHPHGAIGPQSFGLSFAAATALNAALVVAQLVYGDTFLSQVCDELSHRFAIAHTTIQIELGERVCRLAPEHLV